MKILHILDHSFPYFSGYTFRTQYILQFQRNMGLIPIVLTSPKHAEYRSDTEEFHGIRHYRTKHLDNRFPAILSKYPYFRELQLMRTLFDRIIEVARNEKIDLIHAHSPCLNGIPARFAAKNLAVPMVYEIRAFWEDAAVDHGSSKEKSPRYFITRWLETQLVRRTDSVVTLCHGLRNDLISRGIEPNKISVIPNGVDVGRFSPRAKESALIKKYGLEKNIVLGYIGSLYKYEGLEDLITAFKDIHGRRPDTKLMIIGGGEEEEKLRNLVPAHLNGWILFAGKVPHDAILDYYSIIDIFIYPRRKMRLTDLVTPLKPLEALAMGKYVLGSDVGGIKELIEGSIGGFTFRAGDINDLISKTLVVTDYVSTGRTLNENQRKEFTYKKSWENIVKGYAAVYERFGIVMKV